jgi:4-hydroxybenzoate polyprenyltransferase
MCRAVVGLVRASHPEPAAAVTLVGTALAVAVGHGVAGTAVVAATIAASQLAIGWHNDWLDAARDAAVGRRDKPIVVGAVGRRAVGVAALVATAATVPIALLTGGRAAVVAALGLGSALLYNWPLKFTALSVVPYAFSFAALPSFVVLARAGAPWPPWWLVLAGGLLGAGGHFANVLPDLDDDARTGVRGLPHRIGARGAALAAAGLLLAATATLVLGPPEAPSWAGVAALVVAVPVLVSGWYASRRAAARGMRSIAVFRAVIAVALVDVLLLLLSGRLV